MAFKEFMKEVGYNLLTTFWEDFSIADKYGIVGVKDTYKRAFSEWKDDYKFFTELTLVLNHKIWQHYDSNRELAALYDRLWREADEYAMSNFKGEELKESRSTKKHCKGLRKHIANLERRLLKHILANVILSIISVATIIALFTLIQN